MRLRAWTGAAVGLLALSAWAAACGGSGSNTSTTGGAGGVITGAGGGSTSGTRSGPGSSSRASSGSVGPGSGGSNAGGSTPSAGGAGGGVFCLNNDPGEPNDDETTAYAVDNGQMMDCSDSNTGQLQGALDGDEEDWFTYVAVDGNFTAVNPHGVVTANDAVTQLRLCIFIQCLGGSSTEPTCPSGTVPANSPFVRPGCCGTGEFDISLNCADTTDETSEIFMRVDNPSHENVCVPYSLVWHC